MVSGSRSAAMAVNPTALPDAPLPPGTEIRPVTTDADVGALVAVGVAAFDDDPAVGSAFYGAGSRGVDGVRTFVAWERDDPVGISAGYLVRGAVSVMGVAVVPEARRRGFGAALTVHAARSFPSDLAWLHPSEMALPLYEGLGFSPVAAWEIWVRN